MPGEVIINQMRSSLHPAMSSITSLEFGEAGIRLHDLTNLYISKYAFLGGSFVENMRFSGAAVRTF